MRDPAYADSMVWKCPVCEAEWESKEPGVCPQCHSPLYAPRPSFGVMFPLIAAMNMIDEGYDPRDGEIDKVMDKLMAEQLAALGMERRLPPRRGSGSPQHETYPVSPDQKRLVFVEPNAPMPDPDPEVDYLQISKMKTEELRNCPRCPLCAQPNKPGQRLVKLKCGHVMHSKCVSRVYRTKTTCPKCGKRFV